MRRALQILMGLALVWVGACAANPARSSVAVPMVIPDPPPRVAMDPVPAAEPPAEPVPVPATRPTAAIPTPTPPRGATAAAPAPAATTPMQPTEAPPAVPPTGDLRAGGPAGSTPTASQVRESLGRAKQKLDAIDRRRLNAGKAADFDSARRFLEQAEAAVTANNLMLAQSSVEKAETLANGLR